MADATPTPNTQVVAPNGTTSTHNADGTYTLAAPKAAPVDNTVSPASTPGTVPSISSTPAVISSKDLSGGFASDSNRLTAATTPLASPNPSPNDQLNNPTSGFTGTGGKTGVEQGAAGGAGDGIVPVISTGDPLMDSLQTWQAQQAQKAQETADAQKQQVNSMLQTSLAANDAAFAAQIQSLQQKFAGLIDTQTRINNMNISRTQAYGLATGGALGAPLEFTNAVSQKESDAAAAIQNLDNERDSAIAQAQAAQQQGDAKLLSDAMTQVDKIESDMRSNLTQLQSMVTERATLLQKVEADQQAQQKQQAQAALAAATLKYGDQFNNTSDNATKDSIIKTIVGESGGLLDYGTVFAGLQANAATATKTASAAATLQKTQLETKQLQDEEPLNVAKLQAETAASQASAALDKQQLDNGGTKPTVNSAFFSKADKLMSMKDANGAPYTDSNGYLTPTGFKQLSAAASASGISRTDFLQQYADKLYPGSKDSTGNPTYSSYGLTPAEIKTLNGTVPFTTPAQPGS